MDLRLFRYWDMVRASYWFVPSMMMAVTLVGLCITFAIDVTFRRPLQQGLSWIAFNDPDGVRQTLATVAGSVITVAGVSFSVMIVALSLASQQFGPRIIRNFMRDRGNQFVLGVFIATFLGNLLVLQIASGEFIPVVSVLVAWVMGVASLCVLIYFIHHTAELIQADNVIASIGHDIDATIRRIYPKQRHVCEARDDQVEANLPDDFDTHAAFVQALRPGYVQTIDYEAVLKLAEAEDMVVRLNVSPGQFVLAHTAIAHVYPTEQCTEAIADQVRYHVAIGAVRTHTQDVEFGINQLVEMAVRALSPGINDPTTANRCIDRLAEALAHAMRRHLPDRGWRDPRGAMRMILPAGGFAGLVDAAFNQIRQNTTGQVAVYIRLLEALEMIAAAACRDCQRDPLRHHADMIAAAAKATVDEPSDLKDIETRHGRVIEVLESPRG